MTEQNTRKRTTLPNGLIETKAQKLNKLALQLLKGSVTYKDNNISKTVYKEIYQKGFKNGKLEIIVRMLKMGEYNIDFIAKVTKFDKEEIEVIQIAINMLKYRENVDYVVKYTKLSFEEVETIKNELNRLKI